MALDINGGASIPLKNEYDVDFILNNMIEMKNELYILEFTPPGIYIGPEFGVYKISNIGLSKLGNMNELIVADTDIIDDSWTGCCNLLRKTDSGLFVAGWYDGPNAERMQFISTFNSDIAKLNTIWYTLGDSTTIREAWINSNHDLMIIASDGNSLTLWQWKNRRQTYSAP